MDTIFMNSENSKITKPQLIHKLTDKMYLKRGEKNISLSNLSIYYTWKNKKSYNNSKFEISTPIWNDYLELPDGLYLILDIQD